jgi:hypothetical protein
MGLDISYYSDVKRIPDQEVPEGVEPWNAAYDEWEEKRGRDTSLYYIRPDHSYFDGHLQGLEPGWYEVPAVSENYFRGGSYSGYNTWRNDLALAAGYKGGADGAWNLHHMLYEPDSPLFLELINFSDSDGVIGPIISKKLYNDFVRHEKDILKKVDDWYLKMDPDKEYNTDDVQYFMMKYNQWKEAFKEASNNGFVSFH